MAPSRVWRCNIILFTATSKVFVSSVFLLSTLALAAVDDLAGAVKCGDNDLKGSAQRNLQVVQSSLIKNVGKTGYNISSYGKNGDTIYGLAQCRGDLNASTCQTCVEAAKEDFVTFCGNSSGNIYVMRGCFIGFATYNFYSKLSNTSLELYNCSSITDAYSPLLWPIANLLTTVVNEAVASNVGQPMVGIIFSLSVGETWIGMTVESAS